MGDTLPRQKKYIKNKYYVQELQHCGSNNKYRNLPTETKKILKCKIKLSDSTLIHEDFYIYNAYFPELEKLLT